MRGQRTRSYLAHRPGLEYALRHLPHLMRLQSELPATAMDLMMRLPRDEFVGVRMPFLLRSMLQHVADEQDASLTSALIHFATIGLLAQELDEDWLLETALEDLESA